MASFANPAAVLACITLCTLFFLPTDQTLDADFYASSCPDAASIVRSVVEKAIKKEKRMAGSLLRLHYHDCFVNGCDASVLVDDTPTLLGEKHSPPNNNSLRGFEVVDDIKAALEAECPQTVSCADVLAITARECTVLTGGQSYDVLLGRRDGSITNASFSQAESHMPPPTFNVSQLVTAFANVGLNAQDMVVLSGAHTIGSARCSSLGGRLTETNIDAKFKKQLQQVCPTSDTNNVTVLDLVHPYKFDSQYYSNLVKLKGLLHSDQVLYSEQGTNEDLVNLFSENQTSFFDAFSASMIKLGNLRVLTGTEGQIRTDCRKVNTPSLEINGDASLLHASA